METKTCTSCGKEKPATTEYFYSKQKTKDGLSYWCKRCHCVRVAIGRDENPERQKEYREKIPNYYRKLVLKKYNLSLEDYDKMIEKQNGLCAICGLPESVKYRGKTKNLAIDHNHNTDEVRGLLCYRCNSAIGGLKVDNLGILNLEKAIEYLNSFK